MSHVNAARFFRDLENSEEFHIESAKLEFALELKRVMDRDKITNADLAERLKVSRPMVTKLLRGDANVTIETMVKAVRALSGKLFVRIVREGCSGRLIELVQHEMSRPHEVPRVVRPHLIVHDGWASPANDLHYKEYVNEAEPLAA